MQSPFIVNDQLLNLIRYPEQQVTRSLQAWDSADEYLINYVQQELANKPIESLLIFNDNFGAISLNFTDKNVTSVSDSKISTLGLQQNADINLLPLDNINQIDSLTELPENVDVILYKIPKSKNLMVEQLKQISQRYSQKVTFIAADKAKSIQSATLKTFEQYLGETTTSLAVKKARLVFCQLHDKLRKPQAFNQIKQWPLEKTNLTIINYANVFARDKLDIGARLFIEYLPNVQAEQKVIDLGCGNGVIGLSILAQQPKAKVTFVDESFMAVRSASDNVSQNFPDLVNQCLFLANDCLTDIESSSADHILCNPPFHQQNAVTDHIAWQMFTDSYKVLKQGGKLTIVGNRQLGYHIKLKRIFGNCTQIASNNKFVILSAEKS